MSADTPIPVYFWHARGHPNLGDNLSPGIVRKLTGRKILLNARVRRASLFGVGSILEMAKLSTHTVWGSGFIRNQRTEIKSRVFAVRGPLTRQLLGLNRKIALGDPALLLPRVHERKAVQQTYDIGIIPHYVDQDTFKKRFRADSNVSYMVLDIKTDKTGRFIDKLCECKFVVSSSLHGLIIAQAYEIPAVWIEMSDQVIGNGFKFADYFLSVGIPWYQAANFKSGDIHLSDLIPLQNKHREALSIRKFGGSDLLESLGEAIENVDRMVELLASTRTAPLPRP